MPFLLEYSQQHHAVAVVQILHLRLLLEKKVDWIETAYFCFFFRSSCIILLMFFRVVVILFVNYKPTPFATCDVVC